MIMGHAFSLIEKGAMPAVPDVLQDTLKTRAYLNPREKLNQIHSRSHFKVRPGVLLSNAKQVGRVSECPV